MQHPQPEQRALDAQPERRRRGARVGLKVGERHVEQHEQREGKVVRGQRREHVELVRQAVEARQPQRPPGPRVDDVAEREAQLAVLGVAREAHPQDGLRRARRDAVPRRLALLLEDGTPDLVARQRRLVQLHRHPQPLLGPAPHAPPQRDTPRGQLVEQPLRRRPPQPRGTRQRLVRLVVAPRERHRAVGRATTTATTTALVWRLVGIVGRKAIDAHALRQPRTPWRR